MIRSLFSRSKEDDKGLKLKFNKEDNTWLVLKGHSIMFMGQQEQCKIYINQFS